MKILLALDATTFSKEQLNIPAYTAKLADGDITALFLENSVQVYVPFGKYGHVAGFHLSNEETIAAKKELIDKNIEAYTQACKEMYLSGNLHRASGIPVDETIEASRFADLLLIPNHLSFAPGYEYEPTKYTEDVLTAAQCPVLVMPDTMQEINEMFFAYNGGFSSVYAIRQFTHLFPSFRNKKVTVLYVAENDDEGIAHKRYIKEYLQHHYENVEFKLLIGNPTAAILSHLSKQKNCIATFGAYGRSKFSQFFKKSKAENILKTLDIPVFITHP